MVLPENILEILNTLNQAGYEAYVVGGCVRDSLLKEIAPIMMFVPVLYRMWYKAYLRMRSQQESNMVRSRS